MYTEQGELIALEQGISDTIETTSQFAPGDLGAAFGKMILSFAILILLLFASYWFLRRFVQIRLQKGNANGQIQILEKRMMSPKTMLYLIEVDQKKILLAESHLEVKRLESFEK